MAGTSLVDFLEISRFYIYAVLASLVPIYLVLRLILKIEYKMKYSSTENQDPFNVSFKKRNEILKNASGGFRCFVVKCNVLRICQMVVIVFAVIYLNVVVWVLD